jgi:hypothetical protein
MPKSFILISLLIITVQSFGQKSETIYLDKTDSSKNCYSIFYPKNLPWKGYLILIPGLGETAEALNFQTDLAIEASKSGLLTIIPTFQDGVLSFGVDSLSQISLKQILNDVSSKQKVHDLKFFIGGFSIGGSAAVKYAELAYKENYNIKPSAVFAIDPPLDFERMYHSVFRDCRLSSSTEQNPENVYLKSRIEKEFGGPPQKVHSNYYKISPYSYSDTTQSAIKSIVNLPIRFYTEPDVDWWLKERQADFTNMNAVDCSAMINELTRLGNKNANLIVTYNKGYRKPTNKRHPHSWSIVDNDELIDWLLKW